LVTNRGDDNDRRETLHSGRRSGDPPGVPLREHLETLIRGMQVRIDLELGDLGAKVDGCSKAIHKLKGEVHALAQIEQRREGREEAQRSATRAVTSWVQWLPTLVACFTAIAAVVIALDGN
jgi:hypothetical protein